MAQPFLGRGPGRIAVADLGWPAILGALPSVLEGWAFDFAFFLFVSYYQKPFTRPNNRSTLNFDHSLQNT